MINQCELNFLKCTQDSDAVIVQMKYCDHSQAKIEKLVKPSAKRQKRSARIDSYQNDDTAKQLKKSSKKGKRVFTSNGKQHRNAVRTEKKTHILRQDGEGEVSGPSDGPQMHAAAEGSGLIKGSMMGETIIGDSLLGKQTVLKPLLSPHDGQSQTNGDTGGDDDTEAVNVGATSGNDDDDLVNTGEGTGLIKGSMMGESMIGDSLVGKQTLLKPLLSPHDGQTQTKADDVAGDDETEAVNVGAASGNDDDLVNAGEGSSPQLIKDSTMGESMMGDSMIGESMMGDSLLSPNDQKNDKQKLASLYETSAERVSMNVQNNKKLKIASRDPSSDDRVLRPAKKGPPQPSMLKGNMFEKPMIQESLIGTNQEQRPPAVIGISVESEEIVESLEPLDVQRPNDESDLEKLKSPGQKDGSDNDEQQKTGVIGDMLNEPVFNEPMLKDSLLLGSQEGDDQGSNGGSGNYDGSKAEQVKLKTEQDGESKYDGECPAECPSQGVMVCAKCQHGVYRTFLSVCHMRKFICAYTDERLELVSRYPCVLSAPFISSSKKMNMKPKELLASNTDDDYILRYIYCRDEGKLDESRVKGLKVQVDPRCVAFNSHNQGKLEGLKHLNYDYFYY